MRISIRLRKMTDRNEHDQEKFQSVKHFVSLCRHFVNWQVNNNFQSPSNLLLIYNTEHRKEEAPDLLSCKSTQIFLLPEGKEGGNSAAKKSPANKGVSIPLFAGHGLFHIKRFPSSGQRRERGCLSAWHGCWALPTRRRGRRCSVRNRLWCFCWNGGGAVVYCIWCAVQWKGYNAVWCWNHNIPWYISMVRKQSN